MTSAKAHRYSKRSPGRTAKAIVPKTQADASLDQNGAIIRAIKGFDAHNAKGWTTLASNLSNLTIVALDPVVTSIGVTSAGHFSSLANVLLSADAMGFNGKRVQSSLTVPALVAGVVSGKKANIESMELRLREPADGSYASGVFYAGAAE